MTSLSRKLETFERKFNENKAELEDQKFEHEKFKIDLTTKTANKSRYFKIENKL